MRFVVDREISKQVSVRVLPSFPANIILPKPYTTLHQHVTLIRWQTAENWEYFTKQYSFGSQGYWIEKCFHFGDAVNQLIRWIKMEKYCAMSFSVSVPRNSVHSISATKNRILKVKLGLAMISYQLNEREPTYLRSLHQATCIYLQIHVRPSVFDRKWRTNETLV